MESTSQDCDYLCWKSDKEILSIIKDGKISKFNYYSRNNIII